MSAPISQTYESRNCRQHTHSHTRNCARRFPHLYKRRHFDSDSERTDALLLHHKIRHESMRMSVQMGGKVKICAGGQFEHTLNLGTVYSVFFTGLRFAFLIMFFLVARRVLKSRLN